MGFFADRRCYSEHGASASRVRALDEGCRMAATICPTGMAEREMQSASLKEAEFACRRLELGAKESAERVAQVEA